MGPNFLLIGAAKAGTTTLWKLLDLHPEIFLAPRKELQFFSFDEVHARGTAWYESWFEGSHGYAARGEASATYTARNVFPRTAERIHRYRPDMRLIFLAREPLARIESLWLQFRRFGATSPFVDLGVEELPDAMRVDPDFNRAVMEGIPGLVDSTNYLQELEEYRQRFGEERLLVLLTEDLERDPEGTLRACFTHLGVDADRELEVPQLRLNRMEEYRLPRPILARAWKRPLLRKLYAGVGARTPRVLRSALNRLATRRPVAERPQWDPQVRTWVLDRLAPDARTLLEQLGRDPATWGLAPTPD